VNLRFMTESPPAGANRAGHGALWRGEGAVAKGKK